MKNNNVGAGLDQPAEKNKGITLIALIITIIVMLILVAVSIRIALSTGLFESAGKATKDWQTAQDAETELGNGKVNIGGTEYDIDEYISGIGDLKPGERASDGNATYKGVTIPEGFTVSNIPGEYENVDDGIVIYDIPAEDLEDENFNWTDGSDSDSYPDVQQKYNQFVWVPVEKAYEDVYITVAEINEIIAANETEINAMVSDTETYSHIVSQEQAAIQLLVNDSTNPQYPMAVQMENGNYRGILYDFENWNGTTGIKVKEFSSSESVSYENVATAVEGITYATYRREPGTTSYDRSSDYADYEITQSNMQREYDNMVTSVAKYGGFYVARFELTQETVTVDGTSKLVFGSKRGQTVASSSTSSANMWYGLNEACNGLYNKTTDKVQSQMISGAQWDQIMIWMRSVPNRTTTGKYFINYSKDMGNYSDSADYSSSNLISGRVDNFSVKKVFDLGGNLYDRTTEAYTTDLRVLRGGSYDYNGSGYPASGRYSGYYPGNTSSIYTSRTV